jgi:hypothetical protein
VAVSRAWGCCVFVRLVVWLAPGSGYKTPHEGKASAEHNCEQAFFESLVIWIAEKGSGVFEDGCEAEMGRSDVN